MVLGSCLEVHPKWPLMDVKNNQMAYVHHHFKVHLAAVRHLIV